MITKIAMIVLSALSINVQDETIWLRTEDAVVLGDKLDCSLYLNHKPDVIFIWEKDRLIVGVADDSLNFSDSPEMTLVAVKADNKWLNSDKPTFLASGTRSVVTISFQGYSDYFYNLLRTSHITIKTMETSKRREVVVNANIRHQKMPQLLAAVNKCRDQLQ